MKLFQKNEQKSILKRRKQEKNDSDKRLGIQVSYMEEYKVVRIHNFIYTLEDNQGKE